MSGREAHEKIKDLIHYVLDVKGVPDEDASRCLAAGLKFKEELMALNLKKKFPQAKISDYFKAKWKIFYLISFFMYIS